MEDTIKHFSDEIQNESIIKIIINSKVWDIIRENSNIRYENKPTDYDFIISRITKQEQDYFINVFLKEIINCSEERYNNIIERSKAFNDIDFCIREQTCYKSKYYELMQMYSLEEILEYYSYLRSQKDKYNKLIDDYWSGMKSLTDESSKQQRRNLERKG